MVLFQHPCVYQLFIIIMIIIIIIIIYFRKKKTSFEIGKTGFEIRQKSAILGSEERF